MLLSIGVAKVDKCTLTSKLGNVKTSDDQHMLQIGKVIITRSALVIWMPTPVKGTGGNPFF